jgi:hypothetical protein
LSTARGAGQQYHLVALLGGTTNVLAQTDITLMPGDKYTWVLFEPNGGDYHAKVIKDVPVANSSASMAYFRFLNVTPGTVEHLYVGDPNGTDLSGAIDFMGISEYKGIPTSFDTTVTFFVTDANNNILGRLAGVSLSGGSYHTIAWGGQLDQSCRSTDFSGNHVPDDTVRVHMFDDNEAGNDMLPVPVTMRYNIINALIPPTFGARLNYPDYTASGGLNVVINNNTTYDYKNVMPFTPLPYSGTEPANSNVQMSDPKAIPYTGLAYIKLVKPSGANPSFSDSILFRFYGTTSRIVSDQLVSFIVFDTTQSSKTAMTAAAPYDSSKGVYTLQVPDQSSATSATIVFVNLLTGYKSTATNLKGDFMIGSNAVTSMQPKPTAPAIFTNIPAGQEITISGVINKYSTPSTPEPILPDFKFTPQAGGIYEVLCVGQRNRADGNAKYLPQFIVIRTNPKW